MTEARIPDGSESRVAEAPPFYPPYTHHLSRTHNSWVPLSCRAFHSLRLPQPTMYRNGRAIFHYGNHPVEWVKIAGVVVEWDDYGLRDLGYVRAGQKSKTSGSAPERRGKRVLVLDDGSGATLECVLALSEADAVRYDGGVSAGTGVESKSRAEQGATSTAANAGKTPSVEEPLVDWSKICVGSLVKIKGLAVLYSRQHGEAMLQLHGIKVDLLQGTDEEVRCWQEVARWMRDILSTPWILSTEEVKKCERLATRGAKPAHENRKEQEKRRQRDDRQARDPEQTSRRKTQNAQQLDRTVQGHSRKPVMPPAYAKTTMSRKGAVDQQGALARQTKLHGRIHSVGLDPRDKTNLPSRAARGRRVFTAGQYDALGI